MVAKVCFFIVLPKRTFSYSKLLPTNRKKEKEGYAAQNASVQGNKPKVLYRSTVFCLFLVGKYTEDLHYSFSQADEVQALAFLLSL